MMTNAPRLASRVLPSAAAMPGPEKDAVTETTPSRRTLNAEDRARGRRMLGLMMGTLTGTPAPNARQRQVEERLAQRLAAEKEELARQMEAEADKKRQEVEERRREWEQGEQSRLEGVWRRGEADRAAFQLTETEPRLYWSPSPESPLLADTEAIIGDASPMDDHLDDDSRSAVATTSDGGGAAASAMEE